MASASSAALRASCAVRAVLSLRMTTPWVGAHAHLSPRARELAIAGLAGEDLVGLKRRAFREAPFRRRIPLAPALPLREGRNLRATEVEARAEVAEQISGRGEARAWPLPGKSLRRASRFSDPPARGGSRQKQKRLAGRFPRGAAIQHDDSLPFSPRGDLRVRGVAIQLRHARVEATSVPEIGSDDEPASPTDWPDAGTVPFGRPQPRRPAHAVRRRPKDIQGIFARSPPPAMITQTLCSAFRLGKTESDANQFPPKDTDRQRVAPHWLRSRPNIRLSSAPSRVWSAETWDATGRPQALGPTPKFARRQSCVCALVRSQISTLPQGEGGQKRKRLAGDSPREAQQISMTIFWHFSGECVKASPYCVSHSRPYDHGLPPVWNFLARS